MVAVDGIRSFFCVLSANPPGSFGSRLILTFLLKDVLAFVLSASMPPLFLDDGNFRLVSHFHTIQSQVGLYA